MLVNANFPMAKVAKEVTMSVIQVNQLTKDYGHGRGVFDVSFEIKQGEIYGFLGPNGAGKTTTIRHLMGFSKPQKGHTQIFGKDSFRFYYENMKNIGYIPGEIALPAGLTGWEFIDMNKKMKQIKSDNLLKQLLEIFQFDPSGETKRMSLGEKRKLAIITAFMGDPDVLILDEPTSGLDPVMQDVFVDFLKVQKKAGKTIMLSSHMFSEIDTTCDRIAIIKEGYIVSEFIADDLKHATLKKWQIIFKSEDDLNSFTNNNKQSAIIKIVSSNPAALCATFECDDSNINEFVIALSEYEVTRFSYLRETLEDYFMSYYVGDKDFGGAL
jgi:ABC-2 type transport system ATP-binding protein